jgi:hypothetical protein
MYKQLSVKVWDKNMSRAPVQRFSTLSDRRAPSPLDFLLISFSARKPLIAYFGLFNS